MTRVYFDYNAGAPLRPAARTALLDALYSCANPSSPHLEGQSGRLAVETARRHVAALVNAHHSEVIFTGSGTEAVNLAIRGALPALAPRDHVVISAIEHDAVLETATALQARGIRVSRIGVDPLGRIDTSALAREISERTALVAVMLANNETGVLQPFAEVARLARAAGALSFCDAVQAAGKIPVDFRALGCDFMALSSHKLGGTQGVGALIRRSGAPLEPLLLGGGQEHGLRSGTEFAAGLVAFGAAAAAAAADLEAARDRTAGLRHRLETRIAAAFPAAAVNGAAADRLPGTVSLTIPGVDAQALVVRLDLDGFAVSTGSACSSGAAQPSHVLGAMGLSPETCRATLRVSLGWGSTPAEVDRFADALVRAVRDQAASGVTSLAAGVPRPAVGG